FTCSSGVGWGIAGRAARKRVRLELGNSTPVLVAADADLELAATKLAANAFSFAGQSCISVQRIYVERPALDGFLERFLPRVEALAVGDPADGATDVGPVIDADARTRIAEWVEEAQAAGAQLLAGTTDADPLGPIVLALAAADALEFGGVTVTRPRRSAPTRCPTAASRDRATRRRAPPTRSAR